MAEARGKKEDTRLKASYRGLYNNGTEYIKPEQFQKTLTTHDLKLKNKSQNINGLQFADMIAHPSWVASLNDRQLREPRGFGKKIVEELERTGRYPTTSNGLIQGAGRKFLP